MSAQSRKAHLVVQIQDGANQLQNMRPRDQLVFLILYSLRSIQPEFRNQITQDRGRLADVLSIWNLQTRGCKVRWGSHLAGARNGRDKVCVVGCIGVCGVGVFKRQADEFTTAWNAVPLAD